MSVSDTIPNSHVGDAWRGHALYSSCLREVLASKQIVFPKGALRRGQSRSIGAVNTPFGSIELSVHKDPDADLDIEHNWYIGRLLGSDGVERGGCSFSTYRPVRGRGWLSDRALFFSMDSMSDDAYTWYRVLSGENASDFEIEFNSEGLLIADEIFVTPDIQGSGAWKVLYFCTMSAVFAHQRREYGAFVFHAHPFIDANDKAQIPRVEHQRQAKQLRRFYAVHLKARVIRKKGEPTEYMRAQVPYALSRAWAAYKQKRGVKNESADLSGGAKRSAKDMATGKGER